MTEHAEHHHALSYADAIRQYRDDKDAYFRTGHGSPVPAGDRAAFTGIPYFPVDESFIAEDLVLEPYAGDEPVRFEIPTTDGRLRPAERAGVFRFELAGYPHRLTAYRMTGADGRGRRDAVRAVPRRDERDRDVRGRALPRPRARGRRDLDPRLQPRLSPLVRVRPALLVPAHAGREPPGRCGSRRASDSRTTTRRPADGRPLAEHVRRPRRSQAASEPGGQAAATSLPSRPPPMPPFSAAAPLTEDQRATASARAVESGRTARRSSAPRMPAPSSLSRPR